VSLKSNLEAYGPRYAWLLALSGLFALGAIITLWPSAGASWPNILGYKSVCPFAPAATLGCSIAAALTCVVRARLVRRWSAPVILPVAAILVLAALFAWATVAWAGEKAKYEGPDATSAASAAEALP